MYFKPLAEAHGDGGRGLPQVGGPSRIVVDIITYKEKRGSRTVSILVYLFLDTNLLFLGRCALLYNTAPSSQWSVVHRLRDQGKKYVGEERSHTR